MMFYQPHLLKNSSTPEGGLVPPTAEQLKLMFKKDPYKLVPQITSDKDIFFKSYLNSDATRADVLLCLNSTHGDIKLANCSLSTTNYNCSSLHISNIYVVDHKKGLGTIFMEQILKYFESAGYTFLYGNVAGSQFSTLEPFFYKLGFKPLGEKYYNPRSRNWNQWIAYTIDHPVTPDDEDEDDNF